MPLLTELKSILTCVGYKDVAPLGLEEGALLCPKLQCESRNLENRLGGRRKMVPRAGLEPTTN